MNKMSFSVGANLKKLLWLDFQVFFRHLKVIFICFYAPEPFLSRNSDSEVQSIPILNQNIGQNYRWCGGSLAARQTSGAEVSGSNPVSPTMILRRCRIIV